MMNADPQVMEHFPSVLSAEESDKLYKKLLSHYDEHGYTFYAVDRTDLAVPQFVGMIGIANPSFQLDYGAEWTEIGWRTIPSSWGIGLGSEGAARVIKYAFEELGKESIYSFTTTTNKKSERVMQKIGMEHIGFFEHPLVKKSSPLCTHTLYRIQST